MGHLPTLKTGEWNGGRQLVRLGEGVKTASSWLQLPAVQTGNLSYTLHFFMLSKFNGLVYLHAPEHTHTAPPLSCSMHPRLQEFYETTMQRLRWTVGPQEFRSQLAALTIGCGAVAMILCRSDLAPPGRNHSLTGAVAPCAPYAWPMCTGRYDRADTDPTMVLHGLQVFRQAWVAAQAELGFTADNIDIAVPHQVGKKVHRLGAAYCGYDLNKAIATYPYTGNVGPASIGIALSIAEKEGRLKEGMRVCLSAFGSGLNCIFAEVMW